MPKTKDIINTSLRLPRDLHAQLEGAAAREGLTLNAEMIIRLQRDPRADYAKAILEELHARDRSVEQLLRKQIETLWGALNRADEVLDRVQRAIALASSDSGPAALKRDVEFARQLIAALDAHR